jgi:riboflavin kinase/FMN adenylyltransferase
MEVVFGIENLQPTKKASVVAIGVFDGVHLGHQAIIRRVLKEARKMDAQAVVITFEPHPSRIIKPESHSPILTGIKLKTELIEELGVDILLIIKFTKEFSQLTPEEFVSRLLVKLLRTVCVVVGEEFRFGKNAAGDVDFLKKYGKEHNFDVISVPLVLTEGKPISSTRIRSLLFEGNLERAKAILGRYPRFIGVVVRGHGRGDSILGFPTANIETPDTASVPGQGVYAGWIRLASGEPQMCVIDIGTSPTFEKQSKKTEIHVHVPGLSADMYGKHVEVEIQLRIRDEKSFLDEKALMEQIASDIEVAKKALLSTHH